ncbi:MAG: septum formation initiator family protein [Mogibacterium sp.]|nr:septum formation initiator family protein [Mogibacterium sp.]
MEKDNREIYTDKYEGMGEPEEEPGNDYGEEDFEGSDSSGVGLGSDDYGAEGFENEEALGDYFVREEASNDVLESEEDFERRVKRRKAKIARRKIRRKILLVIIIISLFAGLATMCGRDIIRLKRENRELKKRQQELEEERDILKREVEKSGQREYVQDQARRQLRLLNPGELLFTFEDDEGE